MATRSRTLILLLILMLLPALACNIFSEAATPTVAAPTQIPVEVDTPPPVEATSTVENLTTYNDEATGLLFEYPETWAIDAGSDLITIASSDELLQSEQFDREGAGVIIMLSSTDEFEGQEVTEVLAEVIDTFEFGAAEQSVEGPSPTTINGQEAAVATVEAVDEETSQVMTFQYTLVRQGDRLVVAVGVTLAEHAEQFSPTLQAIAESIRLQALTTPMVQTPEGSVQYGEVVRGTIEEGQSSSWSFIGVEGETLDVSVTPLTEQLDVTVDVIARSGNSILERGPVDDAFGTEEIRNLTLPASDEYLVVVSGFARASGEYELRLTEVGAGGSMPRIALDETVDGTVAQNQVSDYAYTHGTDTSSVTVIVQPEDELDVVVEIIGPDGNVLVQEDSSYGREQVAFTAEANRDYRIRVRGFAGAAGDFTLSLSPGGLSGDDPGTTISAAASLPENSESGHDFPFTAAAGDTVYAAVQPDGELDVVVEIWNDDSDELEDQIDLSFGREDVAFIVPETGNYFFKVLGFEGASGTYTITMTGPPSVIFELFFGDAVDGRFGSSAAIEYAIRLNPDETMHVQAVPDANTDVVLTVLDLEDNILAEADEGFSGEQETLSYMTPSDIAEGTIYFIRLSDFSGEGAGMYTLSLENE
ncbi:MAG TPA: hypothetical protein VK879_08335 [Candidatus Sulfomarinibacteraceae bacterium]|nr:hypothetical protein [Candidatus Sulfomarinibacteraceae bacterium]